MKASKFLIGCLILTGGLFASTAIAQYYTDPNYYQNYDYTYGSYPNNNTYNYSPVSVVSCYPYTGNVNCDPNGFGNSNSYYPVVDNYSYNTYNSNYDYNYYNNNYNNTSYYNPNYGSQYLTPRTYAATNANTTSATINGYVAVSGTNGYYNGYGSSLGTAWFQYGSSYSSLNKSSKPAPIYGSTTINSNLTGLACGASYYYRAAASSQGGTQYGDVSSFTTLPCYYSYNTNNGYNNYNNNYTYQSYNYNQNYNYDNTGYNTFPAYSQDYSYQNNGYDQSYYNQNNYQNNYYDQNYNNPYLVY